MIKMRKQKLVRKVRNKNKELLRRSKKTTTNSELRTVSFSPIEIIRKPNEGCRALGMKG